MSITERIDQNRVLSIIGSLFLLASCPSLAFAQEETFSFARPSKMSAEMRGIKTNSALGVLFGWRYMSHESDVFSMGGAAYTGQLAGSSTGSFSYGGLEAALNFSLFSKMDLELTVLAGGAGGFSSDGTVAGGLALEPGLSLSFIVGKTVRTSLNGGYLWMPNSPTFSGITFGVRFEFMLNEFVVKKMYVPQNASQAAAPQPSAAAPRPVEVPASAPARR